MSLFLFLTLVGKAQFWEVGFSAGTAHYFGDLNMYNSMRKPGGMIGGIAKYNFTDYIAMRVTGTYGLIHFSDKNSINPYFSARNLSFYSSLYEGSFAFEFNFFKYRVQSNDFFYTPYAIIGVGVFGYNPKAKLNGTTYNLRDYGTEGQIRSDVTGTDKYQTNQFSFPIGMGFKYWIHNRWSASFEAGYRFTSTDYLDDVSGTFVDKRILNSGIGGNYITPILADRSSEIGASISMAGKQRGDSKSKDGFMFLTLSLTHNFKSDRCPKQ